MDANRKEVKAHQKEVEVTNVLNLQQDGVIIFRKNEIKKNDLTDQENMDPCDVDPLQIEFSNLRSVDLFGIDKTKLSQAQLLLPQFLPLDAADKLSYKTLHDHERLDSL